MIIPSASKPDDPQITVNIHDRDQTIGDDGLSKVKHDDGDPDLSRLLRPQS